LIDLKGWDKIDFRKIDTGDEILMVREDNHRIFTYTGKVLEWDFNHNWWDVTGDWYASPSQGEAMTTTFYKKKFTLPTTPLSIIEGETRHTSGPPRRYFLTEDGGWKSAKDGLTAHKDALLSNFHNWRVIFEGVDLGDS
jgi:hypothetical protein